MLPVPMTITLPQSMMHPTSDTNFGPRTSVKAVTEYIDLYQSHTKQHLAVNDIANADVFLVEGDSSMPCGHVYAVDTATAKLACFIKLLTVPTVEGPTVTQVTEEWANPNLYPSSDRLAKIFVNCLLPRFKICVSDILQTKAARNVWYYRMYHAMERGYHVYGYDTTEHLVTPVNLKYMVAFKLGKQYAHHIIMISQTPLI